MEITIKSAVILFCIGAILLSPFYYLEYIKPRERKKSYMLDGHTRWIYGEKECKILYTFEKQGRVMIKVRYQNNNGRWIEDAFYGSELTIKPILKNAME